MVVIDADGSTVTEEIAQRAEGTLGADLSEEDLSYTKLLILSCVGAMLGGSVLRASQIVLRYVVQQGARGMATVAGTGTETSSELAALANGTFAHATEYEDDSFPEGVSTYTVIPPLLALAEERHYDAKKLMAGVVVGQEIQSLLGRVCVGGLARGYQLLPVLGTVATAGAAAAMMGSGRRGIATAMSISVSQAAGMRIQNRFMTHFAESGFAARAGLLSAYLAEAGLDAAPYILEGLDSRLGFLELLAGHPVEDAKSIVKSWGSPYRIRDVGMKTFPACGLLQPVLQGLVELRRGSEFAPDEVARVEIVGDATLAEVCDIPHPSTHAAASMSLQHNVAVALARPEITIATSFADEALVDPELHEIRNRVRLVTRDRSFVGFELVPIDIRVQLKSGRVLEAVVNEVNGYPPAPLLPKADVLAKFERAAHPVVGSKRVDGLVDLVMNLELAVDAGELARALA